MGDTTANDAAINRAVAERIGWTFTPAEWPRDHRGQIVYSGVIPHFATCLNAMAEAEATLTEHERSVYIGELAGRSLVDARPYAMPMACAFAPARTRALAFLEATKGRATNG